MTFLELLLIVVMILESIKQKSKVSISSYPLSNTEDERKITNIERKYYKNWFMGNKTLFEAEYIPFISIDKRAFRMYISMLAEQEAVDVGVIGQRNIYTNMFHRNFDDRIKEFNS